MPTISPATTAPNRLSNPPRAAAAKAYTMMICMRLPSKPVRCDATSEPARAPIYAAAVPHPSISIVPALMP